MISSSYIELNQKALENNIKILKEYFNDSMICSVVKSNAYGHGADKFVQMAEKCGIKNFAVFSSDEAKKVKEHISNLSDIIIMGWINDEDFEWVIHKEIEFFVFDCERLKKALEIAEQVEKPAKIHLEFETGMNRTGFEYEELKAVFKILKKNNQYYQLKGLCTHLAGAESIANYIRIKDQLKLFKKIHKRFIRNKLEPETVHTASSAASISYPEARFDMLRLGILLYGFWPSKETLIHFLKETKHEIDPLQRVLSWKSEIMSIKDVFTGEFVGYGTSYLAQEDKKIAIIPVGYSNGYNRNLSNQGRVLIRGQRVAVVGMVNMNMLLADVTYVEDVSIGDEVVIIGDQGDLTISVSAFSEFSDQLNYELLARLPGNIPRIIKN